MDDPGKPATHDVVIVGAGSSGCVLAARLSENPARRVLLVEAGPHYPTLHDYPSELLQANSLAASLPGQPHNWSFTGTLLPGLTYAISRGRVVGGSSALNGTYFIRGRPEDHDHWASMGNPLWSHEQVLPYFVRSERDLDFSGPLHGQSGPVPVRRAGPERWRPVSRAFMDACRSLGHPDEPDKNGPGAPGAGPIPRNCVDGLRVNMALAYLAPVLGRRNLTVQDRTFVHRVVFEGTRAVGVLAERDGRTELLRAGEVVLCAGGIKSPHLLMLSGIGPDRMLQAQDIRPVVANPNVGAQLMDHTNVTVPFRIRAGAPPVPLDFMPMQVCLNHSSAGAGLIAPEAFAKGDLQISCVAATVNDLMLGPGPVTWRNASSRVARQLATLHAVRNVTPAVVRREWRHREHLQLNCSLMLPRSRGHMVLASADARHPPVLDYGYLSNPLDVAAMRTCVRTAAELLRQPAMQELGVQAIEPGPAVLEDDAALTDWLRQQMGSAFHTSCGARMGAADSPLAVTDQHGRVHGVQGLRVADLSICPTIVRRGTAATAVMIGERMADLMG